MDSTGSAQVPDSPVNDQPTRSLEERVARLEQSVKKLESTVGDLTSALSRHERVTPPPAATPPPARGTQTKLPPPKFQGSPNLGAEKTQALGRRVGSQFHSETLAGLKNKSAGFWLSRLGIGLLLLGVAFLFKYAVDEGWLTPPIRVVSGLALGLALLIIGVRLEGKRRWFAPVMLGGASATFYITGFAAFQLFDLVSYPVALGFMVWVTSYTFWAAIHSDAPVLAIIGAIGGLGTPLLLYTDSGSVAGLVMYTCLVLVGTSAIYLHRGWLGLLWTTVFGGWSVLGVGLYPVVTDAGTITRTDQWALQLGGVVALLVFWAVPVAREALAAKNPGAWHTPSRATFARMMGVSEDRIPARSVQILALSMPLVTFFFARESWPYDDGLASGVAAALAALLVTVWWRLGESRIDVLIRSMHAVAAALLVAIGLQYAFQNHTLLVTWAVEVLVLHFAARRLNERPLASTAHVFFVVVMGWLATRLLATTDATVILSVRALTNATVIVMAAAASYQLSSEQGKRWYRLAAVFGSVGWCWSELGALPDGMRYVLVAWSAIGCLLLLLARRFADLYYLRSSHVLFGVTGSWLASRLIGGEPSGLAVLNLRAGLHLGVLVGALVGATVLRDREDSLVYRLIAHLLFLAWIWQELSGLQGGHGWVTIAWGLYALVLLLVGLRRDMSVLRKAALATFLAVVVKLFLVDLSQLEPIWRILLFLGFGGLFLVLSYYFSTLWRGRSEQDEEGRPRAR